MSPCHRRCYHLTILVLLGLIWGSGFVIAKYATQAGVHPLGYLFWQSLGPAVLLSSVLYTRRISSTAPWRFYLISGATGIACPNAIIYFAAPHLPAGILAVIFNTVPLFVYPLALRHGEPFMFWRSLGLVCGFIGVTLLAWPRVSLPGVEHISWIGLSLLTPASFAWCACYIHRHRPPEQDSLQLTVGMLLCSTALVAPLTWGTGTFYAIIWPLTWPDWAILLEIVLSSLGYLLFFHLLRVAGPVYYSLVNGVVCLTGLMWGYVIFGETLNAMMALSIAFILLAIALVSSTQPRPTDD